MQIDITGKQLDFGDASRAHIANDAQALSGGRPLMLRDLDHDIFALFGIGERGATATNHHRNDGGNAAIGRHPESTS